MTTLVARLASSAGFSDLGSVPGAAASVADTMRWLRPMLPLAVRSIVALRTSCGASASLTCVGSTTIT